MEMEEGLRYMMCEHKMMRRRIIHRVRQSKRQNQICEICCVATKKKKRKKPKYVESCHLQVECFLISREEIAKNFHKMESTTRFSFFFFASLEASTVRQTEINKSTIFQPYFIIFYHHFLFFLLSLLISLVIFNLKVFN